MNTAYPLLPVCAIVLLGYLTTWVFSVWGIFTQKQHRKFWNYVLLATFLVSGVLGLFSVIKINYKLEIHNYSQLLRWHVGFGVAMVVVSLFHLSWHLKYYFSFRRKKITDEPVVKEEIQNNISQKVPVLLFLLGVLAIVNQLVFIREFISVLSGNELIVGIVMANWLLITGWGAYCGRSRHFNSPNLKRETAMLVAVSFLPILVTGLLYWLKSELFPPGTLTNINVAIAGIFLLLFPVCYLSGYLFTVFSTCYSISSGGNKIGKAYALESIGSLAGGVLFSIILGRFFNTFQVFGLSGCFALLVVFLLFRKESKKGAWLLLVALLFLVLMFTLDPDLKVKQLLFPNQKIVLDHSTRYGNLIVAQQAEQLNFYENNELQFYIDNSMFNEEAVHFAMLQHEHPQRILLISGGISGMIKEIEKYKAEKITYLESNPEILDLWKKLARYKENEGFVEYERTDIRTFLKTTKQVYDVILINLPPPITLGYNRFYTKEFFELITNHCNEQTVVMTSLPSTSNYAEANALKVNASLWNTLGCCFKNRELLIGEKNYFLASGVPLSLSVAALCSERGIENEYVNPYYFDDALLARRSQSLVAQFDSHAKVNHDFHPRMFIYQTCNWLSRIGSSLYLLIILPVVAFIFFFFRLKPLGRGLYTGGFSSASLEVGLMLAYQVFFGSIYLASALFFAVFMGGLAAGSRWNWGIANIHTTKRFAVLQYTLAALALLIPLILWFSNRVSSWAFLFKVVFFFLIFVLAFIVGLEYTMASHLRKSGWGNIIAKNYGADLVGSAFGAYLSALFLVPFLGLGTTCFVVASFNIIAGASIYYSHKNE